ncbi:uncharacterized protein N7511_005866 [Penicillium nucicola]|uniref:uncharacterized protein n=1 Tax=Penicillium nucicola TaxID=1850975 RepID=UPI00254509EB|nr:uncharacterized protein N7511_005866 [Penicillium nucicola]KAJ5762484.1 hypothetical protein N7511_005866 [Penicillium nucicola]
MPAVHFEHSVASIRPLKHQTGKGVATSVPRAALAVSNVKSSVFLHKIAFQYYPLDLNATSNPFLISWWPLALGDPALFHVSLQTACLDEELLAQKGFQSSEVLMADSVTLLRSKIEDISLAVQDGTMNSVITLATIEFGKGNTEISEMHVNGVRRLVNMRGGINSVRQTSPLTARMICWVSMLIMGHPQFETQDDTGIGDGIPPIPEWQLSSTALSENLYDVSNLELEDEVTNVFIRLRNVFQFAQKISIPSTRLHDLTCFVVHRLLLSAPGAESIMLSPMTECIRYAMILYMFLIQGPTYYSHAVFMNMTVTRLIRHLNQLESTRRVYDSLDIWMFSIGMVASTGTPNYSWFKERARRSSLSLQLDSCDAILFHVRRVLWLEMLQGENVFQPHWGTIFGGKSPLELPAYAICASSSRALPG